MEDGSIKLLGKDNRGEVYALFLGNKEYHLIKTVKGALRGGDYHDSISRCLVLSGAVKWTMRGGTGEEEKVQNANELFSIAPNVPHLLESTTDSVIMEWLDREGPFQVAYDKAYSKRIQERMSK